MHLRHFRFADPAECFEAIGEVAASGSYQGHQADFVDGTAFSARRDVPDRRCVQRHRAVAQRLHQGRIYYQSIRGPKEDFLTISDYLWRWDTDWFWCSPPFGVQGPVVRRLWPRKYRRSDVYRKLVALDRRHGFTAKLDQRRGRPANEAVIQDVEIPVGSVGHVPQLFPV